MGYFNASVYAPVSARRCPFCGSTEIVVLARSFYENMLNKHGSAKIDIECTDCDAEMSYYNHEDDPDYTYDHMVAMVKSKWDARHTKPTVLPR